MRKAIVSPGAVVKADTDLKSLAKSIGRFVDGNKSATGASSGEFVVLLNSTISGRTDGLYTAAKAIPANTTIDSSYLTASSTGGLNSLNSKYGTENLGSLANQSALETALTTLGSSLSDMQFKNIRFAFSSVPSSGFFNGKSGYYIGIIKRAYNNVYAVDVQNSGTGSQKGEHITGTYNGTEWTWIDLNDNITFDTTISNLNDTSLVGGHYFYEASATGNPSTTAGRLIQLKSSASSWGGQIAVPNSSTFLFYARMKTSSEYGDWEQLAVKSDIANINSLITTASKTQAITWASTSNAYYEGYTDIAKTGYTPIGIISYEVKGPIASAVVISAIEVGSNNRAWIAARMIGFTPSETTGNSIVFTVLYKKT